MCNGPRGIHQVQHWCHSAEVRRQRQAEGAEITIRGEGIKQRRAREESKEMALSPAVHYFSARTHSS